EIVATSHPADEGGQRAHEGGGQAEAPDGEQRGGEVEGPVGIDPGGATARDRSQQAPGCGARGEPHRQGDGHPGPGRDGGAERGPAADAGRVELLVEASLAAGGTGEGAGDREQHEPDVEEVRAGELPAAEHAGQPEGGAGRPGAPGAGQHDGQRDGADRGPGPLAPGQREGDHRDLPPSMATRRASSWSRNTGSWLATRTAPPAATWVTSTSTNHPVADSSSATVGSSSTSSG